MTLLTVERDSPQHRRLKLAGPRGARCSRRRIVPFFFGPFRVSQFTLALIYAIAVLGLNLLVGYSGQISLGHGAFFALGAYTGAILLDRTSIPHLLTDPRRRRSSASPPGWRSGCRRCGCAGSTSRSSRSRSRSPRRC